MTKEEVALISALISAFISAVVSFVVNKMSRDKSELDHLHGEVMQINLLAMQYPYLEDDAFCSSWGSRKNAPKEDWEKYQRYDNYCCIVFNVIERIFRFYGGRREKIEGFLAVKELIRRHKSWWAKPSGTLENINGYPPELRNFVNSYLK